MKGIVSLRGLAEADRLSLIGDMVDVSRNTRLALTERGSPSQG
ncbi:hypothetical protein PC116_g32700 [Phytophthora cactorum]|nr:hypothetical protein PC116_g32700 [Phytophthora cactorum]